MRHPVVVLMGVAGSGKSTIGPRLAAALGVPFVDGDDNHSDTARAQMAAGRPLDDAQRGPWLDRLRDILAAHSNDGVVLACSALTVAYRQRLAGDGAVVFLALVAPSEVLEPRLDARPDHFAGPDLLPSQLATLELGTDVYVIDAARPIDAVTADAEQLVRTLLR